MRCDDSRSSPSREGRSCRRVAPLKAAVEAVAAFDADAATVWQDNEAQRRRGQGHYVDLFAASGDLRTSLTSERATDRLVVLMSHRVYHDLTAGCGWSHQEWKTWIVETLAAQLLETEMTRPKPPATDGLG